jgi:hypothetical protein
MRFHSFRVLALACGTAVLSLSLHAQTPPAKPASKPTKSSAKGAPQVAAKPKEKLMTRDELRVCFDRKDANAAEAKAVEAADKDMLVERDAVLKRRDSVKKEQDDIEAAEKTLLADNQAVAARGEVLKVELPKMSKKEQAEARAEYERRVNDVNGRIEPHNARKRAFLADAKVLEAEVDAFNKRKEELSARADKVGDLQEAWRNECGNRPYDELDEIAIKKEKAAKAAAGK